MSGLKSHAVNEHALTKPFRSRIALVAMNCYDYMAFSPRRTVDKGLVYGGQENRVDVYY